jgi:hypothetical protein
MKRKEFLGSIGILAFIPVANKIGVKQGGNCSCAEMRKWMETALSPYSFPEEVWHNGLSYRPGLQRSSVDGSTFFSKGQWTLTQNVKEIEFDGELGYKTASFTVKPITYCPFCGKPLPVLMEKWKEYSGHFERLWRQRLD